MTPESSRNLLAYTPMLHARLFTETAKFRDHHFQPTRAGLGSIPPAEPAISDARLDGNPAIDRPLFVQFCANDPEELLEAARYVRPFCDAVDLNLGCPQGIARKGRYGAFLQEDQDLIYRLINTLHEKLDIPVTAKIRILETKEDTLKYAKMVVSAGASILTVHGRQRDQKGHKTGLADWSVLRFLRENLPPDTVLFANGNILQHSDIQACLDRTGADGVMSAEGNLCDPAIFAEPPPLGQEGREYWRGRNGKGGYRMDAVFRRYMDILYQYVLEKPLPRRKPLFITSDPAAGTVEEALMNDDVNKADDQPPAKKQKRDHKQTKPSSPNLLSMQAHLFHLLRPLVSKYTDARDALARSRAGDIAAFENVLTLVEKATREGLLDYEAHPEKYEELPETQNVTQGENREAQWADHDSSATAIRECKRPWWVCQSYVRPLPKEALQKGSLTLSKKERLKMEEEEKAESQKLMDSKETSAREKLDVAYGIKKAEIPKEAMVCG